MNWLRGLGEFDPESAGGLKPANASGFSDLRDEEQHRQYKVIRRRRFSARVKLLEKKKRRRRNVKF